MASPAPELQHCCAKVANKCYDGQTRSQADKVTRVTLSPYCCLFPESLQNTWRSLVPRVTKSCGRFSHGEASRRWGTDCPPKVHEGDLGAGGVFPSASAGHGGALQGGGWSQKRSRTGARLLDSARCASPAFCLPGQSSFLLRNSPHIGPRGPLHERAFAVGAWVIARSAITGAALSCALDGLVGL